MQPGEGNDAIGLALRVTKPAGVNLTVADAVGIGIIRDLKKVSAELAKEAQLILRGLVVDERCESTRAIGRVVQDLANRRSQAVVAAIAAKAGVPGE